ncbi:hypothetical protein LNQ82_05230 [Conchiformibius steedae DSM 2580]|uniref:Uncharacterized protein n=1 Tax=Conchiformibius steedae DSM 2580 TaxID=1121352 RepID=A0AAE9KYE9_9NEIS|nr:hypothetical protein [Conchiformibius steedae]QMT33885.1 hypothetical protein H3L98_02310 [Conchiformibius steedae]URD66653.1 hypothetical protein LNQ82_05230 [Conchiformibius steedae DSM 2580]
MNEQWMNEQWAKWFFWYKTHIIVTVVNFLVVSLLIEIYQPFERTFGHYFYNGVIFLVNIECYNGWKEETFDYFLDGMRESKGWQYNHPLVGNYMLPPILLIFMGAYNDWMQCVFLIYVVNYFILYVPPTYWLMKKSYRILKFDFVKSDRY